MSEKEKNERKEQKNHIVSFIRNSVHELICELNTQLKTENAEQRAKKNTPVPFKMLLPSHSPQKEQWSFETNTCFADSIY